MPHFTVHMREPDLSGAEPKLIAGLTDAVAEVYGERFRSLVVVELFGVPDGRWGVGGVPATSPAPVVTLNLREAAFHVPEIPEPEERLIAGITDAVAGVLGEEVRPEVTVGLVGVPAGRSGVGGAVA